MNSHYYNPFLLISEQNKNSCPTTTQMDFLLTGINKLIQAWTQKLGAERTIKRKQETKQTGTKEDVDSSDATNYVPKSRNAELFSTKAAADEFFVHFSPVSPTQWKRNDRSNNKRGENVSLRILHKVALSCCTTRRVCWTFVAGLRIGDYRISVLMKQCVTIDSYKFGWC